MLFCFGIEFVIFVQFNHDLAVLICRKLI